MAYRSNRRKFLQTTAAVGVGYWVAGGARAEESKSPNEKVGIACLGYGLKGGWDFEDAHRTATWWPFAKPTSTGWPVPRRDTPRPSRMSTIARCWTRWTRASTGWSSARPTTATASFPWRP